MADARENLKEAQKTESRSIEEPKIRTPDLRLDARKRGRSPDLGPSESARRSDWRHEKESRSWAENRKNEDSGLRINETGQSLSLRDVEMQRRSHETESRSLPHKKRATNLDWGGIEYPDRPGERDRPGGRSWAENRENEVSGVRINSAGQIQENLQQQQQQSLRDVEMQRRTHEAESRFLQQKKRATIPDLGESESKRIFDERSESDYPDRPGARDCRYYLKTGLCSYGRHCVLNHPRCKFFLRGACKYGSACRLLHPKDRDGAEPVSFNVRGSPMRQEILKEQKRQGNTKNQWVFNLEKRVYKDISQICDEIVEGYKRTRMEEGQGQDNLQEQRQRENIEWQRREAQENVEEQRLREEQRKKDIEKQRKEGGSFDY